MKNYDEVTKDLLKRRDRYAAEQKTKRKRMMGAVAFLGCFCLIALCGVGIWNSGILTKPPIAPDDAIFPNYSESSNNMLSDQSSVQSNLPAYSQGDYMSDPAVSGFVTSQTTPNNSSNPVDNNTSNDKTPDSQGSVQTEPAANSQVYDPSDPPVTVPIPSQTTPNNSVDPGGAPSGNPHAVQQLKAVSYQEAKDLFGHPIVECFESNLINYEIKMISQRGDWNGYYTGVNYNFTNGFISLIDQDRLQASAVSDSSDVNDKVEYNNHTFFMTKENYLADTSKIEIRYCPKMENGLGVGIAYFAQFDKSVDLTEIMDLILSLEIK